MLVHVSSLDDPRLDDYRDVREKDRVERRGIVLVEGDVVVRVLARRGTLAVRSLLLAEPRVAALADVVGALGAAVPIYVAPQALMNDVVGFPIHRGVLAACDRGPAIEVAEMLARFPGPSLVIALEGLANHDNVGGIFRNAAAFGADAVLFDETTCDPLYRKAIRVSVGAALFVPFARAPSTVELVGALRSAGYAIVALTPAGDAIDLRSYTPPPRVALLLGAEGSGLSPAALGAADFRVKIPMASGFDSLNVATTSGVALFALRGGTAGAVR